MRFYIFLLLALIETVLSKGSEKNNQRNCKKANTYERLYENFPCSNMKPGDLNGSRSYDEILKRKYFTGRGRYNRYEMIESAPLKLVACAKMENDHDMPVKDACGFRVFSFEVIGQYDPALKRLSENIEKELKQFAKAEKTGKIIFNLGCNAKGGDVICVIRFNPNGKEKKPKRAKKAQGASSRTTQPKGDQDPASPTDEESALPAGPSIKTQSPTEDGEGPHNQPDVTLGEEAQQPHASPSEGRQDEGSEEGGPGHITKQANGSLPSDPVEDLEAAAASPA